MITVHRFPVIDRKEEIEQLKEEWQDYIDAAQEYSTALSQYEEAVEEDANGESREINFFLDRLSNYHEELKQEESLLDDEIEGSSLRGHGSYPFMDEEAAERFPEKYGVDPEEMLEEDPEDFYFAIADDFVNYDGVEWRVERKEIDTLKDMISLIEGCDATKAFKVPAENPELPEIDIEGKTIGLSVFNELYSAYREASEEKTLQVIFPYEEYLFDEYGESAMEELWGIDMEDAIINKIKKNRDDASTAQD